LRRKRRKRRKTRYQGGTMTFINLEISTLMALHAREKPRRKTSKIQK
jgi:hypothetical protein